LSPGWLKLLTVIGCEVLGLVLILLLGKLDLNWWSDLIVVLVVPCLMLGAPALVLTQKSLF
jgi:type IV secretory pathway VirB2 component (pilin)